MNSLKLRKKLFLYNYCNFNGLGHFAFELFNLIPILKNTGKKSFKYFHYIEFSSISKNTQKMFLGDFESIQIKGNSI